VPTLSRSGQGKTGGINITAWVKKVRKISPACKLSIKKEQIWEQVKGVLRYSGTKGFGGIQHCPCGRNEERAGERQEEKRENKELGGVPDGAGLNGVLPSRKGEARSIRNHHHAIKSFLFV